MTVGRHVLCCDLLLHFFMMRNFYVTETVYSVPTSFKPSRKHSFTFL